METKQTAKPYLHPEQVADAQDIGLGDHVVVGRIPTEGLQVMAGGKDRTQEMIEHMTRVQLRQAVMASVYNETSFQMAGLIADEMTSRGAGVLSEMDVALMSGTSLDAVAAAMPRVALRHPGNQTVH